MANVLFTYEGETATVSILKEMFPENDRVGNHYSFVSNTGITPKSIDHADTVILIRPTSYLAFFLAKRAREAGCGVYTFLDDDLLNYRPTTPWRMKGLKGTLETSVGLISFSKYLLKKYKKPYPQLKMIHIDMTVDRIFRREKEEGPVLKLVYAASRDHSSLFEEYISEALKRIGEKYPGMISMTFVGCNPRFDTDEEKIRTEHIPGMPLKEYREHMHQTGYDIGLAPLKEAEFSKCKYYNKFVEYSMYGICGIFSNTEPYAGVVTDELGILADNTTDGWYNALEKMITRKDLRDSIRKNIYTFMQEHNSKEKFHDRLKKGFPEIERIKNKASACKRLEKGKVIYRMLRPLDKAYFFIYYAKNKKLRMKLHA